MMMMRTTFAAFISLATLFINAPAHAQSRGSEDLQRRVYQLESTVYRLSQRLDRLEWGGPDHGNGMWVCSVRDMNLGGVYQGKAKSRVEAAANANNLCVSSSSVARCETQADCERL
ncbi:hypothetical protein [Bdellovibrio sp. KM01]|uniref:hypothetical protein n=1 Tax=Bdellovibrio sp. KM01 TaxID=2748865 RepID=UPI0015EA6D24|nr:hypothetical protein [Bdellovibrio sp. KM01]QLY24301.1 hypothetical protein HW988_12600 [Bdellovibrio sp. KM01]